METVEYLLENANFVTKEKIERMINYLNRIINNKKEKIDRVNDIKKVKDNLSILIKNELDKSKNLLFLGGYKGLINSIYLNEDEEINSAVFIDCDTMLPHGLVSINLSTENNEQFIN